MGDDHPGQLKLSDGFIHQPFPLNIQMAGCLVQEEQLGLAIQGACKDHPLLLTTREGPPMSPIRLL